MLEHDYSKNVVIGENLIARGGAYELHMTLIDEALAQAGFVRKRDGLNAGSINVMLRLADMAHRAGYVQGANEALAEPIDMILHCPNCGMQHIDEPKVYQCQHPTCGCDMTDGPPCQAEHNSWHNPPHRSHLCHGCGHIWRPADVPTNGVAEIKTKGKNDSAEPNYETQSEAQGYALEAIHQFCPELTFREDGQTLLTPAQVETVLRRMGWRPPSEMREPKLPCDTYQTASGDHTVCKTCGETWSSGKTNACLRTAEVLRKAAEHHGQ